MPAPEPPEADPSAVDSLSRGTPSQSGPEFPESFSAHRRLSIAASVLLSIVAVLSLAVTVNYLAVHHAPRFYWGAAADYQLSPLTRGALEALTNRVHVTVFFNPDREPFPAVRALLTEYSRTSPLIQIDYLDYSRRPVDAQEFRRRFPMTVTDDTPDLVLFESGGQTKAVAARDLRDYDTRALLRGEREVKPVAFKGESLFTSAINAVTEGRARRVFFLDGHREHNSRSDAAQTGYRKLAALLEEDNIEVSELRLAGSAEIPRECELLIIAGAQDPFTPPEIQSIDRFLRRGGRLLVLFHYRAATGLERLLADWGIQVTDSLVLDDSNTENGLLAISRFANHPVTRPLARSRLYLFQPRALEVQAASSILGAPAQIEALMRTGTNGVAVTTFVPGGYRFSAADRRGEIPLAVAVERGALPGVAASLGTTRIVAVGDSTFLANQFIDWTGNGHFASTAVNWLLDRSQLLGGIAPTPIRTYQVAMTPFQGRMLRLFLLLFLPGTSLAVGFFVWWRRH